MVKTYMDRVPTLYCAVKLAGGFIQDFDPKVFLTEAEADKRVKQLNASDLKKLNDPGKKPVGNNLFLEWEKRQLFGFIETSR